MRPTRDALARLVRAALALTAALVIAPVAPGCIGRECADQDDVALPGDSITITLRNDSSGAIFIEAGTVCEWAPFSMTRGGDEQRWNRGPCDFSCTAVIDDDCACDRDCDTPQLIRLEGGASYDIVWDRAVFSQKDLSLDCPADGCPTKCTRRKVAGEATYSLSASAGDACADGEAACSCASDTTACILSASISGTASRAATAQLVLPDAIDDQIVLAFR